ncbi:MAG: UDP-N-acetylmuramate dehydrogenase [Eudoraea sp.]|nr:UDP-N-acetylmuramate dehydrogenase [Muriicola sp.]NNE02451.1 UDP-N-acetylmuramate dehydrogenase [Eudoraea sp.]
MNIQKNIALKEYNTFGINAIAKQFVEVTQLEELRTVLQQNDPKNIFVLGGGSNMLLTKDLQALVVHVNLKGIDILEQTDSDVLIKVMAGENWHELVLWTLSKDYGGLENLSLIPGSVGSAPIQNIGAYGVELKDYFESCDVMHIDTQRIQTFTKEDCKFGYRESFFKNEGKGEYVITSVNLRLSTKNHTLHTSYGTIETELQSKGIEHPTITDISKAVIAIRQSKLPDPKQLGNSGSFFKNPIVDAATYKALIEKDPSVPSYKISEDVIKIPAGWLIEACGLKGMRVGDAGVHKKQALVLVNYGSATGKEILDLSQNIQETVFQKFGIRIEAEVNII